LTKAKQKKLSATLVVKFTSKQSQLKRAVLLLG
jgi:hypothetical protein